MGEGRRHVGAAQSGSGGRPETATYWVIRDKWGRVIGGAKAVAVDDSMIALDVEVAVEHRRRGHATRLYEAIAAAGIDVEAGSDTSLEFGRMTPLGYAFCVGRRRKHAAGEMAEERDDH